MTVCLSLCVTSQQPRYWSGSVTKNAAQTHAEVSLSGAAHNNDRLEVLSPPTCQSDLHTGALQPPPPYRCDEGEMTESVGADCWSCSTQTSVTVPVFESCCRNNIIVDATAQMKSALK